MFQIFSTLALTRHLLDFYICSLSIILNMSILQPVSSSQLSSQKSMIIGYMTLLYIVFFAVFFFNFDHMFFCFCPHIFCNFSESGVTCSLTSYNRKGVLFLATKPLTCTHINSIWLSSVSNGGSYYFMSV